MIFQDPMTSLNPVKSVGDQVLEVLNLHFPNLSKDEKNQKVDEIFRLVGIPAERKIEYPHQFSGGMKQRIVIAMALSCNAKVLIADEPTTALDVTIQAQILELIQKINKKFKTAVILITHDLGVVAGMCDNVCVMYAGRIVEQAPTEELYAAPSHPYTQGLIASVPRMDESDKAKRLFSIEGQPPNVIDLPPCCPFHPRCHKKIGICEHMYPPVKQLSETHTCACWLHASEEEIKKAEEEVKKNG